MMYFFNLHFIITSLIKRMRHLQVARHSQSLHLLLLLYSWLDWNTEHRTAHATERDKRERNVNKHNNFIYTIDKEDQSTYRKKRYRKRGFIQNAKLYCSYTVITST